MELSFCELSLLRWCCLFFTFLSSVIPALGTAPAQQHIGEHNGVKAFGGHQGPRQPNIILMLTDDQDLHMSSLDYMPHLQAHLIKEGTFYRNHYCTVALCCPSRVSFWTGKHAHNTNVTDVNPPHGGYPKFVSQGLNDAYLPLWLQNAGYDTYYVGKLFNALSTSNYDKPYPRGWNASDFLLDPYTYEYLNTTMQRNIDSGIGSPIHEAPRSYEGQYVTDVIADKSFAFLNDAIAQRYEDGGSERPFFLAIAPTAPHINLHLKSGSDNRDVENYAWDDIVRSPPISAKRHEKLFPGVIVPRTPDFNPNKQNTVSWLKDLSKQNQSVIDSNDDLYRQRLRALQAVDEIIPRLIMKLEFRGIMQETYVIYTTDNGYHIGQHRLPPGKRCAYETDINVPMIVRGPDVVKGRVENKVSSHVDIASTFLSLAGVDPSISRPRYGLDGQPMVFHAFAPAKISKSNPDQSTNSQFNDQPLASQPHYQALDIGQSTEHVNIETWGAAYPEGEFSHGTFPNHTYKALRVISSNEAYNLLYVVWCTNEHELYDLRADPYALHNLLSAESGDWAKRHIDFVTSTQQGTSERVSRFSVQNVVARLDALMMVLKTCRGKECTHPWEELHGVDHSVKNLFDAMASQYDEYYLAKQVEKVQFERCEAAYIPEAEGAMWSGRADMWGVGMI